MNKIVFASNNLGKYKEVKAPLAQCNYECILQSELQVPEVEETGKTFVENALLKARNACYHTNLPVIADDSGLLIDCLKGDPGLYSARYAGKNATSEENIDKVLQNLVGIPSNQRSARFYCVIVLLMSPLDPMPKIFEGQWEGSILTARSGSEGLGYDPIFQVPTHNCSAAELPLNVKHTLSHRGQSLTKCITYLQKQV